MIHGKNGRFLYFDIIYTLIKMLYNYYGFSITNRRRYRGAPKWRGYFGTFWEGCV